MEEKVILTGGMYTMNTVSVYSSSGWIEDLPDLLQGRSSQGCGHYINDENRMVIFHRRNLMGKLVVHPSISDLKLVKLVF